MRRGRHWGPARVRRDGLGRQRDVRGDADEQRAELAIAASFGRVEARETCRAPAVPSRWTGPARVAPSPRRGTRVVAANPRDGCAPSPIASILNRPRARARAARPSSDRARTLARFRFRSRIGARAEPDAGIDGVARPVASPDAARAETSVSDDAARVRQLRARLRRAHRRGGASLGSFPDGRGVGPRAQIHRRAEARPATRVGPRRR